MLDWITGIIEQTGYVGVALLMLAENVFPPIPSEVIMPLAGYVAAKGGLNIFGVVFAGTVGSVAGALFWYEIGRRIGHDRIMRWTARHGRWTTLHPRDVDQASQWFHRHGGVAVFVGRLVPTIRSLISVPAGVARMPLVPFLLYSTLGTALWSGGLAGAGYLLESSYSRVGDWLGIATNVILGLALLIYIYRVLTFRPSKT